MSKLINEDWEHAAYATDEMYSGERDYIMNLEWQEWEHTHNKKPATIIVQTPVKDENAYITRSIRGTHQKKL